jgi:hypothetical protein
MPKSFMEDGAGAAAEKGYINLAKNTPALRAIDAHAGGPAYQDRPENRPRAGGRLPVPRGLEGSRREMRVPPRRVPERTIPRRRARLED